MKAVPKSQYCCRLEQGYSRRPADDPYFRPPRDSVHALTELERLNQLERMRQMELDLIQREKRELEMGLVPGPYFPRSPMDPLSPPYRYLLPADVLTIPLKDLNLQQGDTVGSGG